jgi:CRP-like cAMP-binding protein
MHRLPGLAGKQALHFARGDWIFHWGDECTGGYLVERGAVKLAYHTPLGAEKVLAIVGPGESFGEEMVLLGGRWTSTARALVDSTLLHLPARRITEELSRDASLAPRLLATLSRRLTGLLADLAAQAGHSGTERLVAYLLEGTAPGERLPRERALARKADVASRLGMSPEHFSRVLRRLESAALIEVRGRRVRIPDPARLRAAPI